MRALSSETGEKMWEKQILFIDPVKKTVLHPEEGGGPETALYGEAGCGANDSAANTSAWD